MDMGSLEETGRDEHHKNIAHELGERIKELTVLHSTASIFQKHEDVAKLLMEIVSILPMAWQYPEVTAARITYDEASYESQYFAHTAWRQSAGFATADGKKGIIEIFYLEEKPPESEGPFLAEERNLINSLAEMIRIYLDRKHANDALLESEERFRETFERAAVGIMHVDIDGTILRANSKYCDILGYAGGELIGRRFRDITCHVDVDRDLEYMGKLVAGRIHTFSFEIRFIRKNARALWANQTVSLVRGPRGEPKYFIFVVEDISDRKQVEADKKKILHDLGERVKELTAMYGAMEILQQQKTVPELLQDVVVILPDAWQYPEISAARITFGGTEYSTANFRETDWSQIAAFSTYDAMDGFVEVVYLDERPDEAEGPFLEEERDLIDSIAELLRSFLNRKTAEKALVESEKLYKTLAEAAHDMIYMIDGSGRFIFFNDFAGEVMGDDPEELIGKTGSDVYPPEVAERHELHERHVWESAEPVYFEEYTPFPHKSLWTGTWLVPVENENGEIASLMGIVRDIDSRKKAEEAMLRCERDLARSGRIGASIGYLEQAYRAQDAKKEKELISRAIEELERLLRRPDRDE
jgi:PAS domain S-box-containing protein